MRQAVRDAAALHHAGRSDAAAALLAELPGDADALGLLGVIAAAAGRLEDAVAAFDAALALAPHRSDLLGDRGNALLALGRAVEALACYDLVLAACPRLAAAHAARALALGALDRDEDALAALDRAGALDAAQPEIAVNRGVVLRRLGRFQAAMSSYDTALALRPDDAEAMWNKGLLLLLLGEWTLGWRLYESRTRIARAVRHVAVAGTPWRGDSDPAGRSILVQAEQGFGDTIQFCRYALMLRDRGARVHLAAPQPLLRLLSGLDAGIAVHDIAGPLPVCDLHCPLASLPLAFGTTLADVPSLPTCLRADPAGASIWSARLGPRHRPRLGLAWRGRPEHGNDARRSVPVALLAPLLALPVDWVAVQPGLPDADAAWLRARGGWVPAPADLPDFAATAALMAELDGVVSVDTAVAHLAGALGVPIWVLLPDVPDWRWLLGRSDSPWYPSARLVRQASRGDWAGVVARVVAEIGFASFGPRR